MNKLNEDTIICRCEEVTVKEIKEAINGGATSVDGVKRVVRAGKGLCQGRTCRCLVENIISQEINKSKADLQYPSVRPPVRVMKVKSLAKAEEGDNE
jgi:NAD(P)H-nitrite reductase large subunit